MIEIIQLIRCLQLILDYVHIHGPLSKDEAGTAHNFSKGIMSIEMDLIFEIRETSF